MIPIPFSKAKRVEKRKEGDRRKGEPPSLGGSTAENEEQCICLLHRDGNGAFAASTHIVGNHHKSPPCKLVKLTSVAITPELAHQMLAQEQTAHGQPGGNALLIF